MLYDTGEWIFEIFSCKTSLILKWSFKIVSKSNADDANNITQGHTFLYDPSVIIASLTWLFKLGSEMQSLGDSVQNLPNFPGSASLINDLGSNLVSVCLYF